MRAWSDGLERAKPVDETRERTLEELLEAGGAGGEDALALHRSPSPREAALAKRRDFG